MEKYGKADDLFSVKGKNAIITGGTRGLGKAMASFLIENGCNVLLTSRNVADNEDMLEHAKKNGVICLLYPCDTTHSEDVVDMVKYASEEFSTIEILINCAGVTGIVDMLEFTDEEFRRIIDTNLVGTFIVIREVSRIMKEQNYGKIINMSSVKGFLGVSDQGYTAYCASKGGINMLTVQVACELARYGITCNAIAPTFIRTAINLAQLDDPEFRTNLENRIPMGRIGEKKDLMGLVLLLASDASSFITGQIMMLDGGITARQ